MPDYLNSSKIKTNMPDYFNSSAKKQKKKKKKEPSKAITKRIHNEFNYLFSGIGCFRGIFSFQVKDGSHLYQAPPRRIAYALQKPLKEELEQLQKQQIIAPLGVEET